MNPRYTAVRSARHSNADYAVDLRQWRRWFDGEGDGGGTTTTTDNSAGAGTEGNNNGGSQTTLTQEQANKLIGEARKKGREAAVADLLKELGFEKADDLKALVTSAKERADAEKSEAQKAAEAKEAAEKKAADLAKQLDDERAARRKDRLSASVLAAAKEAEHPEDVLEWAERHAADKLTAVLKDDGSLDDKALEALMKAAKEARPAWFKGGRFVPGTGSHSGGRMVEPGKEAKDRARLLNQRRIRG
jgi:hypothetical protein